MTRQKVSLCMIVRDEEQNIPKCLGCVADLVDEIIVVDTGSTDGSREKAAQLGARVFDYEWEDSFAAARNEALRHATGDWIFWLDARDRIGDTNRRKLAVLFRGLKDEAAASTMKYRRHASAASMLDQPLLFRKDERVRWRFRIEEQLLPALAEAGAKLHPTNIVIRRVRLQDDDARARKAERNLKLLELDLKENPEDAYKLFRFGQAKARQGKLAEAIPHWRRSVTLGNPRDPFLRELYPQLAQAHEKLGETGATLATCLAGLAQFPKDAELLFLTAAMLEKLGHPRAAEACQQRVQKPRAGKPAPSAPRECRARIALGRLYQGQKRPADAGAQYRLALAQRPQSASALSGLGEMLIEQERWEELAGVLAQLDAAPAGAIEAALLRGLQHLARREFAAARAEVEKAVVKFPQAIELRLLLSRALWPDRDQNPWGIESALRDVLALDPTNTEAKRRLEKLYAMSTDDLP